MKTVRRIFLTAAAVALFFGLSACEVDNVIVQDFLDHLHSGHHDDTGWVDETDDPLCAYECLDVCLSIGGTVMPGDCLNTGLKCCNLGYPIEETDTVVDTETVGETETVEDTVPDEDTETVEDTVPGEDTETVKDTATVEDTVPGEDTETVEDTIPGEDTETAEPACVYTCVKACKSRGGTKMEGACPEKNQKCCLFGDVL